MARSHAIEIQRTDSGTIEVIPVLDVKQGRAVRAIGGIRDEYRPITSRLTQGGCPITLAKSFLGLDYKSLYLADLDAIAGAAPNRHLIEVLASLGLELWIDAGVSEGARALATLSSYGRPISVIAGLETLPHLVSLQELVQQIGAERLIFSLDLFQGRPLRKQSGKGRSTDGMGAGETLAEPVTHASPPNEPAKDQPLLQETLKIVEQAAAFGVRRIIVLDLARVGGGTGAGNLDLLRAIGHRWPTIKLISGGGVRSRADLEEFARAGCRTVLVGSALHDGSL